MNKKKITTITAKKTTTLVIVFNQSKRTTSAHIQTSISRITSTYTDRSWVNSQFGFLSQISRSTFTSSPSTCSLHGFYNHGSKLRFNPQNSNKENSVDLFNYSSLWIKATQCVVLFTETLPLSLLCRKHNWTFVKHNLMTIEYTQQWVESTKQM